MSGQKFTFSDVRSFLTHNLTGLKKIIFRPDNMTKKELGRLSDYFLPMLFSLLNVNMH